MSKKKGVCVLKAEVDPEFFKRVQSHAKAEGERISTIVRRATRNYLNASQQ